MTSPQYMPLYVGDYLADAAHISTLSHGAYLLLIMNYWQRGKALPANDRVLAGIAKLTPEQWADVKLDLADFFQEVDGCWRHKRIEQELETARGKVAKASAAGKASAEARANARSTDAEQPSNHKIRLEEEEKKEPLSEKSDAGLSLVAETGKRAAYPEDFEHFWKAYPTDALMSKKKAAAEWKKLPSDKRALALVSCPAFKAHCQANPDYRPVHACRYLSEERFVGFAATQERVSDAGVHIMAGDPGWDEWQAVKKTPTDAKGGWWFPSKFPDETARMGRRAA